MMMIKYLELSLLEGLMKLNALARYLVSFTKFNSLLIGDILSVEPGKIGVLALILRKPGKLGLVFWKRELSGSGRGTRFHSEEWMNGWEVKNRKQ